MEKNWVFAVPKTQCKIDYQKSNIDIKAHKIIIWVKKVKKDDNWFSLHKQKTVGGADSDWKYLFIE